MSFPNTLIILSLGARWVYLEVPKPPAKCSQQASLSRAESRRPSPLKRFPLVGWHLLFVFNSIHSTSHGKPLGLPKVSSREQQGGGAGFAHWFQDTGYFFLSPNVNNKTDKRCTDCAGLYAAPWLQPGLRIVPNSSDPANSPCEGAPYLWKGHARFLHVPRKILLKRIWLWTLLCDRARGWKN